MNVNFLYRIRELICCLVLVTGTTQQVRSYVPNDSTDLSKYMVTIGMDGESLESLFFKIEAKTDLQFIYSFSVVRQYEYLKFPPQKRSVKDLLDDVFEDIPLDYELSDKTIYVSPRVKAPDEPQSPVQIFGKVTDRHAAPLVGANIIIKNTAKGTSSDVNGDFQLTAMPGTMLWCSFIGYEPKALLVEEGKYLNVVLEDEQGTLDEVVVNAGYWKEKEWEKTGNISRLAVKQLKEQPEYNVLAAMQGRIPGVYIQQETGVAGGAFKIFIHGQNSIREEGNPPLYIVDGVPYISTSLSSAETSGFLYSSASPLAWLNLNDVQSIEVLKDADATAIYGSRGANGVVLISTRRELPEEAEEKRVAELVVNYYHGVSEPTILPDLLNTRQYLAMRQEAFENDELSPSSQDYDVNGTWDPTAQRNWQKILLGNPAYTQHAQIAFSDQNPLFGYAISIGYHKETLPFIGDNDDDQLALHADFRNVSSNQKLKNTFTLNYTLNNSDFIKKDLTEEANILAPNAPVPYDSLGNLNWADETWDNPFRYLDTRYEAHTDVLIANWRMEYVLTEKLSWIANLGYTDIHRRSFTITPLTFYKPSLRSDLENQSMFADADFRNWIVEPQLSWTEQSKHAYLNVLIGASALKQQEERVITDALGFSSVAQMNKIGAAATTDITSSSTDYRYLAAFGRINYKLYGRYILELTGRRDGTSRFGAGKRFATFGAAGAAWIFSDERWIMRTMPWIYFGKLRASYGITGSDQIGDYQYIAQYNNTRNYGGVQAIGPDRLENKNFAWESTRKLETAIDLDFFRGKMDVSFAYFRNISTNQLVGTPLPSTTGFTSIQNNYPLKVLNTGYEVEIGGHLKKKSLQWNLAFNLTVPRNKLLAFPNIEETAYNNSLRVGHSLNIQPRYRYLGIDSSTGLYSVEDVNNDGVYNSLDQVVPTFVGQHFFGGFYNSLQYKNFEFSFLVQFVKQTNESYLSRGSMPGRMTNQDWLVMRRWRSGVDGTKVQRFSTSQAERFGLYARSNAGVVDASFFRMKNLSLAYNISEDIRSRVFMKECKIFLRTQNFFTWTPYKGADPEWGINLPPMKRIVIGVQISF